MKTFNEFVKNRKAISQLCAYFEQILDIAKKIKNLIAADRNGDWEAHLQAVQELIPIFAEYDSIHYFRYGSYHLEFMKSCQRSFQQHSMHSRPGCLSCAQVIDCFLLFLPT